MPRKSRKTDPFVEGFRHSAPYIHRHRNRTFVVLFGGEAVQDPGFANLIHDIALLNSLGIRLVLVHGARPQIEQRLKERKAELRYVNGLRVTDDPALGCVKEAVGVVRMEVEALLSMGLANTPMSGVRLQVSSGNFVTARPLGVRDGVDYCHTGEVRRIETGPIQRNLDDNRIVLLSPVGYSPTGEMFNLHGDDVAAAAAVALKADKLIVLVEGDGLLDSRRRLLRQLTLEDAQRVLDSRRRLPELMVQHLESALRACRQGVPRTHLVSRLQDGALLLELFTRDGCGTLITSETYEGLRPATLQDVVGILDLIVPLEEQGLLVRRSREHLEQEINRFLVVERDGMIIACGALYAEKRGKAGELACLAVHPEYRGEGRGEQLLESIEKTARSQGIERLFVLTTQAAHWFRERGFRPGDIGKLPVKRRNLYNWQRKSKVFVKPL